MNPKYVFRFLWACIFIALFFAVRSCQKDMARQAVIDRQLTSEAVGQAKDIASKSAWKLKERFPISMGMGHGEVHYLRVRLKSGEEKLEITLSSDLNQSFSALETLPLESSVHFSLRQKEWGLSPFSHLIVVVNKN